MRLHTGVSVSSIIHDAFVLAVFVVGFSLGAAWQYIDKQGDKIAQLNSQQKEQKISDKASVAAAKGSQEYTQTAVGKGYDYVETADSCVSMSDSEYRLLNDLVETSNKYIGGVPTNSKAKKQ